MSSRRLLSLVVVGLVALATGFLVASQLKAELLSTPSSRLARYQALVRNVQDLEKTNEAVRGRIASLRADITALEAEAAQRSATTRDLQAQVAELRAHAGLTPMHGPGVEVDLGNGIAGPDTSGQSGYLVNYQDVQDTVNLLFADGAEGVAVNGRRITPLSSFSGSAGAVVVDQGPPLIAPIHILAIGDRNQMVEALDNPTNLPDIRARQVRFQLAVSVIGSPDVSLPAYDSSLQIPNVSPI